MSGLEEIFQPGFRHWKEWQDRQRDKVAEAPIAGPGPIHVDLDNEVVIIEVEPEESDSQDSNPDSG